MSIHTQIKARREALGWSHSTLAAKVSELEGAKKVLAWQTVQQWENGGSAPKRTRLVHVAAALNCTVEDLMSEEPSHSEAPISSDQSTSRSTSLVAKELASMTLGSTSMRLAELVADLSPSRRKTISHLFAAQIAEGPNEHEAKAIDSLAPGVDLVAFSQDGSKMMVCEAKPVSDWHRTALHLANAYQDDAIRPYLERFVEEVATFMANEAQPLKTEQARLTYLK